jgi:hypothetical protein
MAAPIGGARGRLLAEIHARNETQRKELELQYTREIFKKFDSDKSGTIDSAEFQQLCEALGYVFASKSEVDKAVSMIVEGGSKQINWTEFATWWQSEDKFRDFEHLLDDHAFYHDDSFRKGRDEAEAVQEDGEEWPEMLLHPFGNFRTIWDGLSAIAIIYSALFVPYRTAYEIEISGSEKVFDRMVDASFLIDMVLTFFTAYYDAEKEIMITDKGKIATTYLKGWFVPDFLASVPFDSIAKIFMDDTPADKEASDQIRLLKMIRLLRLLKILRMVKMSRLLTKFQESMQVKSGIMISVKFALLSGVTAHYLACGWYVMSLMEPRPWQLCKLESQFGAALSLPELVVCDREHGCPSIQDCDDLPTVGLNINGTLTTDSTDQITDIRWRLHKPLTNWVYRYFVGIHGGAEWIVGDKEAFPWGVDSEGRGCEATNPDCTAKFPLGHVKKSAIYTAAFYWSITTMTTLGFGEINGSDTEERYFVMCSIALGCVIFAYGITNMCTLVANLDAQAVFAQTRSDEIIEWMSKKKAPSTMKKRVMQFFTYKTRESPVFYHGDQKLLNELSEKLLETIRTEKMVPILKYSPIFNHPDLNKKLLLLLSSKLEPQVFGASETITDVGIVMSGCYFIVAGTANVYDRDHALVETLCQGDSYGEQCLLKDCRAAEQLLATSFLDVYVLTRDILKDCCKKFRAEPEHWEEFASLKYKGDDIIPEPVLKRDGGTVTIPGVTDSEVELRTLRSRSCEQEDMIAQLLINLDNLNKFGDLPAVSVVGITQ